MKKTSVFVIGISLFLLMGVDLFSQDQKVNFNLSLREDPLGRVLIVDIESLPSALLESLETAGKQVRLITHIVLEQNRNSIFGPEIIWNFIQEMTLWKDPVVGDIIIDESEAESQKNMLSSELVDFLLSVKEILLPENFRDQYDSIRVLIEFQPQVTAELFLFIDLAMGISTYFTEQVYTVVQ